jgi:AcrR family transcriptional regulator
MATEVDVQPDTHEEIMGATYRALCKHGYAHLTMQDIADEFDKSRSLLHYHYDTKEELLLAFVDNIVGYIGDRLAESETEEPLERLEEYVDRFVIEPGEEDRETFALALLELRVQAVHNEAFRERLATHYETNVQTVSPRSVHPSLDASRSSHPTESYASRTSASYGGSSRRTSFEVSSAARSANFSNRTSAPDAPTWFSRDCSACSAHSST